MPCSRALNKIRCRGTILCSAASSRPTCKIVQLLGKKEEDKRTFENVLFSFFLQELGENVLLDNKNESCFFSTDGNAALQQHGCSLSSALC